MNRNRLLLLICCIFSLCLPLAAQELSADEEALLSEDFDELDDIFSSAEDVEGSVVNEGAEKQAGAVTITAGPISIPLRFSGYLTSWLGAGMIREDGKSDWTGYFDLYNYLYLYARPDKTFSVRATVMTSLPSSEASAMQAASMLLRFKELYFDYLLLDRLYITAGRKATTWGYPRLFTTDFDETKNALSVDSTDIAYDSRMNTNILSDSLYGTSLMLRLPVWTGTVSAFFLHRGTVTSMDMDDMAYAGSVEMTIKKTSLHLFARRNPNEGSDIVKNKTISYKPHLMGMEVKRTIFGADAYAQDISQFRAFKNLRNVFTDFDTVFVKHLVTVGVYNWWDAFDPNVGFNVEYQMEYVPTLDSDSLRHTYHRIYLDAGVKRLGPKKNIKVGVEWQHQFVDNVGYVKPGVIVSDIFPHADWDTGLKVQYGDSSSYVSPKITFGTYIKLALNY